MSEAPPDIATTLFTLPPDAKLVPVHDLSPRIRARIGVVENEQSVITRPGFRVTARLVPNALADLLAEFRVPTRLTDAVLRFARARGQDPFATLELAFEALATFVAARILLPHDAADALAPVPTLAAGQDFAGFEIEALVRSLDDSEVFRARGPDGTTAALKIGRGGHPGIAAMLANEAGVLERLAGVIAPLLVAHDVAHGRPYLATEWCAGVSVAIAAQQARATRDRRRLHAVVARTIEAYASLHAQGILHGDVHPGNCLVRDDGDVVLVDFGSARAIGDEVALDPRRTGIPQFYDPQLAEAILAGRVPPGATAASEQYAVCVLAYLLLTGLQPVDSSAIRDELLTRIVTRRPLPFAARGVAGWPAVEAVLARGLARAPEDRHHDVATLARAFRSAGASGPEPPRVPDAALAAFGGAIEDVRMLRPSLHPLEQAWFALRAAMVLEDAGLLAAADVLARRAGEDWAAQAVAALVARARSDARMERHALGAFLADVEQVIDPSASAAALAAAAGLLDGAACPSAERTALATWAAQRLDELIAGSATGDPWSCDPRLAHAGMALVKAGAIAAPPDLPGRVEALEGEGVEDVWLWALAYDLLADERFRTRALAAPLPAAPLARGLALLRRYQVTGDPRFVADANQVLADAPASALPPADAALLVVELQAPELAVRMPCRRFALLTEG